MLVNFFGTTFDEYVACGAGARSPRRRRRPRDERLLPQHQGGRHRVRDRPTRAPDELVRACRAVVKKPLWIKLTPNTSDIVALARACADGGADGLSIINTITGHGDRRAHAPPEDRDGVRRALRPRHQADRACAWSIRSIAPACRCRSPASAGSRTPPTRSSSSSPARTTVQVGTQSFVDPDTSGHIVRDLDAPASRPTGSRDVRELVGASVVR